MFCGLNAHYFTGFLHQKTKYYHCVKLETPPPPHPLRFDAVILYLLWRLIISYIFASFIKRFARISITFFKIIYIHDWKGPLRLKNKCPTYILTTSPYNIPSIYPPYHNHIATISQPYHLHTTTIPTLYHYHTTIKSPLYHNYITTIPPPLNNHKTIIS